MSSQIDKMSDQNEDWKEHMSRVKKEERSIKEEKEEKGKKGKKVLKKKKYFQHCSWRLNSCQILDAWSDIHHFSV